jgi:KipI family sensor histidine kinase inhibitor
VSPPRFLVAGESALSVELGDAIDPILNARVRALDALLAATPFPGFLESVPTYRSLLVLFDPLACPADERRRLLRELASRAREQDLPPAPLKTVPTVYDGEDLEALARSAGLPREDVVRLHAGTDYTVHMLGFAPGFAYLGTVTDAIASPRRRTPRTRVPAGSVAIAGRQTGIYPSATPGGWNLIGRTALSLFDPGADPPTYLQPGDRVRFVPVGSLDERGEPGVPEPPRGGGVLEVLEAGLLTTVQDLGRAGFQRLGVPVAGALDGAALRGANLLLGNPPGAAALECTVAGPRLRLLESATLAVTGADLRPVLERSDLGRWEVPPWSSFLARAGSVLSFEGRRSGSRAYLAVAGGLDVPLVLGSRSTDLGSGFGGFGGRALRRGDVLPVLRGVGIAGRLWPQHLRPALEGDAVVRVLLGPQDDHFTPEAIATFLSADFTLGPESDRMGCRLGGPRLAHRGAGEIVSDGNVLGSVQVPPDGRPIVLLADRGSTGGYPRIATVIAADIARVGQLLPGDRLRFREVGLGEATRALAERRDDEARGSRAL